MLPSKSELVSQLHADTEALALPNGRRVGYPGHDIAHRYLVDRLRSLGIAPWKGADYALTYDLPHPVSNEMHRFTNLIGVIPGMDRSLPPILLGAHYDSVIDAPCADDNATSVAMNLAIAEAFRDASPKRDLIIALFDSEEPPHFMGETMGSLRFYEDHCQEIEFAGVIISDLIGHDLQLEDLGLGFPGSNLLIPHANKALFVLGAESDPTFPGIVENAAGGLSEIRVFPTLSSYIGAPSDHYAFEAGGQPTLFLSCAQGKYYHHEKDDLDWINFEKLAAITRFTASCIEGIDSTEDAIEHQMPDLVRFEVRMIRAAVGPALPLLLKKLGISLPTTRKEIDQLMEALVYR